MKTIKFMVSPTSLFFEGHGFKYRTVKDGKEQGRERESEGGRGKEGRRGEEKCVGPGRRKRKKIGEGREVTGEWVYIDDRT